MIKDTDSKNFSFPHFDLSKYTGKKMLGKKTLDTKGYLLWLLLSLSLSFHDPSKLFISFLFLFIFSLKCILL